MFGVYCAFHTDKTLEGLDVYQITLGTQSVLVCKWCADAFRKGSITLSGL